MTYRIAPRPVHLLCLVLFMSLLGPLPAYPQTTLTGAMWFASTSTGATSISQAYADGASNTIGGDQWYDLWVARNPDATFPVNGPSDAQADIFIPLHAGNSYKYYIFTVGPCCTLSFSGLNLFFDGNGSTPGISVFGALGKSGFLPDGSSTLSLEGNPVSGSGRAFYSSAGVVVVVTGYDWNNSATPPGDVCQAFAFTPAPGDVPSAFGSFTLKVFPAAALSLSQTGGPPGTKLTITGTGFAPLEVVNIYADYIAGSPLMTTTTDASGGFTISASERPTPYGPVDFYAVGLSSGKLGAASFFVTAAMVVTPNAGVPGDAATATGFGFGAREPVDIYWGVPRQLLGTTTANGQGTSSLKITIPANARSGLNAVLGVGETTQASAFGKVVVK